MIVGWVETTVQPVPLEDGLGTDLCTGQFSPPKTGPVPAPAHLTVVHFYPKTHSGTSDLITAPRVSLGSKSSISSMPGGPLQAPRAEEIRNLHKLGSPRWDYSLPMICQARWGWGSQYCPNVNCHAGSSKTQLRNLTHSETFQNPSPLTRDLTPRLSIPQLISLLRDI